MLAEVLWSRFIFLALFCYLYIRPYERSPRILIWDEPRTAGSNSPSTHRKLHLLSMQPNFHRSTQFRYFGYPTPYLWYEVALGVEYHDWSCHTAFDSPSLQSKVLLRPWVRGKSQDESKRLARMRCRKETSPRTQLLKHASGLCILSPVMKNFLPPMSVIANKEGLCNRTVLSLEKPHGIVMVQPMLSSLPSSGSHFTTMFPNSIRGISWLSADKTQHVLLWLSLMLDYSDW